MKWILRQVRLWRLRRRIKRALQDRASMQYTVEDWNRLYERTTLPETLYEVEMPPQANVKMCRRWGRA